MPIKLCCTETPEIKTSPMSFSICDICNTIQLDKLIPLDILYSSSHNTVSVGKVWEGYFNSFCEKAENLILKKNVLEIGDPSGRIANRLDGYKKWYIVEPNKNESVCFKENICFIEGFFDDNLIIDCSINMIVHSHVFEHIYNPNEFLKKCYDLLSYEGEMFFGVPNMEYIANEGLAPCLGIFFEHTIFLNKENISYMLEKNGFKIIEIMDYENHSLLFHVKKYIKQSNIQVLFMNNKSAKFMDSLVNWQEFVNKCIIYNNYNIYLFGASYNTQYLLSLGLSKINISGILDNCIQKQGKYLYGYNLKIYNPEIVKDNKCIIIIKNGYYTDEITSQLKNINVESTIISFS